MTPSLRPLLIVSLFASVLLPAATALAGPSLLCPEAVLTDAETAALATIPGDAESAEKVRILTALLEKSDTARFHGEAIRWFRLRHSKSFPSLARSIEAQNKRLGDRATAQDRFDLTLATVIEDWDSKEAREAAVVLSEIADATGEPAQLIYAAEAHDLVFRRSRVDRRLASALSLAHCRRAAALTDGATEGEAEQVARLLATHLPFLEGTHRGEPAWEAWIRERKSPAPGKAGKGEVGRKTSSGQ